MDGLLVWPTIPWNDSRLNRWDYESLRFTAIDPEGNMWSFETYAGELRD